MILIIKRSILKLIRDAQLWLEEGILVSVQYITNSIVDEWSDAIVNPANSDLNHKGGAAKAIADAAGEEFFKDCNMYIEK